MTDMNANNIRLLIIPTEEEPETAELISRLESHLASKPDTHAFRVLDEIPPLSAEVLVLLRR